MNPPDKLLQRYETILGTVKRTIRELRRATPDEHERLLMRVWSDLLLWARWFDERKDTMGEMERGFHEFAIRHCKGFVKLWRYWLVCQRDQRNHGTSAGREQGTPSRVGPPVEERRDSLGG